MHIDLKVNPTGMKSEATGSDEITMIKNVGKRRKKFGERKREGNIHWLCAYNVRHIVTKLAYSK